MNQLFPSLLVTSIAIHSGLLHASQESAAATSIDEIVVTGTQSAKSEQRISAALSIVNEGEIFRRNSPSALQLLDNVEGVHISQAGGLGGVASLYIRGAEPNFATVLIDGVQVNDPNNTRGGSYDFTTLNVAEFDKIEIVRGPQSAIYGSDALAGVVNFISNPAQASAATLHLLSGESGLRQWSADADLVLDNHQFELGASDSDGGEPVAGNTFASESYWLGLRGASEDGRNRYQLKLRRVDSQRSAFPDDSGGSRFAVLRSVDEAELEDESVSFSASRQWNEHWRSEVLLSSYTREDFFNSPGVAPGIRGDVPANRFSSELERRYGKLASSYAADNFHISFGLDFEIEDGKSDGAVEVAPQFFFPASYAIERETRGLYVETEFNFTSQFALIASLRHDDPDQANSETSPGLGFIYTPIDRMSIRGNWGQGFKLPSFFALVSPLVGNPSLRKEQVETLDLGITHQFNDAFTFSVTLFDSEYTDLIDFDSDNFTNVNRARVDISGIEFSAQWNFTGTSALKLHSTYTDIDVINTPGMPARKLLQRPDWRTGAAFYQSLTSAVDLSIDWLYVDKRFDSSIPTAAVVLDDYSLLDVNIGWRFNENLAARLTVANLFDDNFYLAAGFPAAGRNAHLTLSLSL